MVRVGIPDDDFPDERPTTPGWALPVAAYFREAGATARYVYDFGDDWGHHVTFEACTVEPAPCPRRDATSPAPATNPTVDFGRRPCENHRTRA